MKTAGVGSILSVICVGFASACSSPVSIGHNDNKAITADSGPLGTGGQGTDDGGSTTSFAGRATGTGGQAMGLDASRADFFGQGGSAGGSAGPPPGFGPSSAFETSPGSLVEVDGGSGCTPLDSTGAVASGTGWTLLPGVETNACIQHVLEAPADIYAVHSVNSPGVTRSWVSLSPNTPPAGSDCVTDEPAAFLHTVNAYEQLTIFNAPIHANAGASITGGFNVINVMEQPLTGDAQIWLLASPPPSMVPCALHGASAGMDGAWELDPGQETMQCMRLTLNSEHQPFIVRVENGSGAMESVLSYGDPTGPNGVEACDETSDAATQFAIVVGATTVEAKPRDARMLPGQQLVLRVHAVNVTDRVITGEASARIF